MKANTLREKNEQELKQVLFDLAKEQFNLRIQKAVGQLSNSGQLVKVRRNIARVNTVLAELKKEGK